MKALLFSALLLFASYSHALTLAELIQLTPGGTYVGKMSCYLEEPPATHVCIEFKYEGINYRAAVNPETKLIDWIFTPPSELFPKGEVPLDYFLKINTI